MYDDTRIFLPIFQAGGGFYQRADGLVISDQFHQVHRTGGNASSEIVSFVLIDNVPEREIGYICHALGLPPRDFQANGTTYARPDGMTVTAQYRQGAGPVPTLFFLLDNVPTQEAAQLHKALGLPMYPEWEPMSRERFHYYFPWFPAM